MLGLGPNNEAMISRAGLAWRDRVRRCGETVPRRCAACSRHRRPSLRTPRPAGRKIPVHWAAMALQTCRRPGRTPDGLMLYLCAPERYHQAVERMRRGAIAAKRDPAEVSVSVLVPAFIHDDLAAARQAAREFLVHYAGMPHYAKAFDATGYLAGTAAVRRALAAGDQAAAMAALSDRLLDAVLLVGAPARCRERLAALREAGMTWVLLGPQRVNAQSLAEQAEIVVRQLAPADGRMSCRAGVWTMETSRRSERQRARSAG